MKKHIIIISIFVILLGSNIASASTPTKNTIPILVKGDIGIEATQIDKIQLIANSEKAIIFNIWSNYLLQTVSHAKIIETTVENPPTEFNTMIVLEKISNLFSGTIIFIVIEPMDTQSISANSDDNCYFIYDDDGNCYLIYG